MHICVTRPQWVIVSGVLHNKLKWILYFCNFILMHIQWFSYLKMLSAKCRPLWCGLRLLLYRVIMIFDWAFFFYCRSNPSGIEDPNDAVLASSARQTQDIPRHHRSYLFLHTRVSRGLCVSRLWWTIRQSAFLLFIHVPQNKRIVQWRKRIESLQINTVLHDACFNLLSAFTVLPSTDPSY